MTRQPSDINPNDVFPPSDLPGAAQAWGRVVEDRIIALENGYLAQKQSLQGFSRAQTSNFATVAEQMSWLSSNGDAISTVASGNGSELSSVSDNTLASLTLVRPPWANRLVALGLSVVTTSTTNQTTNPLIASVWTSLGGTSSTTISVDTTADLVFTTKAVPVSVEVPVSGDVLVTTKMTPVTAGASVAWSSQLSVIAFWYA